MRRMVTAVLALAALPAAAGPPSGVALFRADCATCHGLSARGEGPMASVLAVEMPDLTLLSARNGGVFPLARVVAVIDGREALAAHGGPMPLYGFSLDGRRVSLAAPDGEEIVTGAEIAAIAGWLAGVQR